MGGVEVAPTRRSSRMAQRFSGAAVSGARIYEVPRPPMYFGSVALASHPFPIASTLALQFSEPPFILPSQFDAEVLGFSLGVSKR